MDQASTVMKRASLLLALLLAAMLGAVPESALSRVAALDGAMLQRDQGREALAPEAAPGATDSAADQDGPPDDAAAPWASDQGPVPLLTAAPSVAPAARRAATAPGSYRARAPPLD